MRIAAYRPAGIPESFRVYCDGLIAEFERLSCSVLCFEEPDALPPDVDVVWDPRAGGGNPPLAGLCGLRTPLVVAVHGVAPMALRVTEYFPTWRSRVRGLLANRAKRAAWRSLRGTYAAVVTGTLASKRSITAALPIDPASISTCSYGVDHTAFRPPVSRPDRGHFLHVSNDEPRKNVARICEAYRRLPKGGRPPLKLKLPPRSHRDSSDGIEIIKARISDEQLTRLYQGALAFVFPSLYEGFGLPILEAMACGCPVITSQDAACSEVAGGAALTVNPRSIMDLRRAMESLVEDEPLRRRLRVAGLRRAGEFSWATAAECHLELFGRVAREWSRL